MWKAKLEGRLVSPTSVPPPPGRRVAFTGRVLGIDPSLRGTGLALLYLNLGRVRVNSIHHQAVKDLGKDLVVEALSVPDSVIEAIRWSGPSYVVGVQWHPEFHDPGDPHLLDGGPLLQEFLAEAAKARLRGMQQVAA